MKESLTSSPRDSNDEISALIRLLVTTERRLQQLTGNEVDAVLSVSGESYLLRQAQDRLRQNEALLRMAGHTARMGGWSVEIQEKRVVWSDEVCAIHEVPYGTLPSLEDAFDYYAPEWRTTIRKAFEGCVRDRLPFDLEAILITAKGNRLWVHAMGEAMVGEGEKVVGVHGAFQDITERKQAEEKLRQSEMAQKSLAAAQISILNALPAHIALIDGDGVIVAVNEGWRRFGGENALQHPSSCVGQNYLEICDSSVGAHSVEARDVAAGIRTVLKGTSRKFELEYPCHSHSEQRWYLLTVAPMNDGSDRGAVVMHMDITARRLAEDSKRRSEERFRSMFAATATGIAISTPDGHYLQANDAYCRMLGYSEEELLTRDFASLTHPDDLSLNLKFRDELLAGLRTSFVMEKRYVRKEGSVVWTRHSVSATHAEGGEILTLIVVAEDITDRKRVEERYRRLVDSNVQGVIFWNTKGEITEANDFFLDLVGYTREELKAGLINWIRLTPPEYAELDRLALDEIAANGTCDVYEKEWIRRDGTRVPILLGSALFEDNAEEGVCFVLDLTERKKSEEALRTSEKRFKALFEQAAVGVAMVDAVTKRYLHVNKRFGEILGRRRNELGQLTASGITHPDDVDEIEAMFHQLTTGAIREFSSERRLLRKDGATIWVNATYSAMWAPGEPPNHFIAITQDITERKLTESRYRRLVDSNVQSVIFWNTNGAISDANDAFLRLVRYSREDLEEGRIGWAAMTPPEYSHLDKLALEQMAAKGFCETYEKEWIRKDGTRVPILVGATVFEDNPSEGVCFVLDRSESLKAEAALRASETRFKALFEQAAVGVAQVAAATNRYLHVNQRFCDILGRTRDELVQLSAPQITHPETVERDLELVRQLNAGVMREFTVEKRYLRPDGSEVWANVTVSQMWADGEPPDYYIAIVQDITSRKKLEDQYRQAQKMEAMGTLAGGIAHDFNNILTAILGFTQLADLKLQGNPEVREYLGAVLKAGLRAADLVRQILTFSRQQPSERKVIELRPVVDECLKLLRATTPATIEFDIALANDAPSVLADASQVHQVILNLGTNALHAMDGSAGLIGVKLERCVVDAAHAALQPRLRQGTYSRVSVSDNGCGMDKATVQRIFEPFFTTKPEGQGTGLGLSVVHGIMESHDGAVIVYSQPGEGTVFHLYFPAHSVDALESAAASSPAPRGHGERVLFVDDEELLVQLGKMALTGLGYNVDTAQRPEEALKMVLADPSRFDVVLTDQTMPGMTGLVLSGKLRLIRQDLPIILMTGFSGQLSPERVESAGIRELLLKPASIQAMGVAIHEALSGKPSNNRWLEPPAGPDRGATQDGRGSDHNPR